MGTCGQLGYVFWDFCLEQGIEFIIFGLNQGIKNRNSVLKWIGKSVIFGLKQGQGMRGRAAPPHPGIYRVPPPGNPQPAVHTLRYREAITSQSVPQMLVLM